MTLEVLHEEMKWVSGVDYGADPPGRIVQLDECDPSLPGRVIRPGIARSKPPFGSGRLLQTPSILKSLHHEPTEVFVAKISDELAESSQGLSVAPGLSLS